MQLFVVIGVLLSESDIRIFYFRSISFPWKSHGDDPVIPMDLGWSTQQFPDDMLKNWGAENL